MDIQIKQATPEDWQIVQKLNNEVFENNLQYDKALNMEWPFQLEGIAHYKKVTSHPDYCTYIAFDGDLPIGHIVGGPNEVPYRAGKIAEIYELGVSPDFRSKGIGELLVGALKKWCKQKGYNKLLVNSYYTNEKAVEFYKKLGMEPIDIDLEMDI